MKIHILLGGISFLLGEFAVGVYADQTNEVLESPKVTNFGDWTTFHNCSPGYLVTGYQLKVEEYSRRFDNTALNGIRFFCGNSIFRNIQNLTAAGYYGAPTGRYYCNTYAKGFQMKSQSYQGRSRDDVAAINLRLICADNTTIEAYNERNPDTYKNSSFTAPQICPLDMGICGLQAQIERPQGIGEMH